MCVERDEEKRILAGSRQREEEKINLYQVAAKRLSLNLAITRTLINRSLQTYYALETNLKPCSSLIVVSSPSPFFFVHFISYFKFLQVLICTGFDDYHTWNIWRQENIFWNRFLSQNLKPRLVYLPVLFRRSFFGGSNAAKEIKLLKVSLYLSGKRILNNAHLRENESERFYFFFEKRTRGFVLIIGGRADKFLHYYLENRKFNERSKYFRLWNK